MPNPLLHIYDLVWLVLWNINHCRLSNAKSSLYIYIIWFGWFLWHINHCSLFNAKSSLYIYYKYMQFGLVRFYGISTIIGYSMPNPLNTYIVNMYDLVWFYGISTIIGYLMPNPLYTYLVKIYDLKTQFVDNILNRTCAHFFLHVDGFKYCYDILILFTIDHLFARS